MVQAHDREKIIQAYAEFDKKKDKLLAKKLLDEDALSWFDRVEKSYNAFEDASSLTNLTAFANELQSTPQSLNKLMNEHRRFGKIPQPIRMILGFIAFISLIAAYYVSKNSSSGLINTFFKNPPTDTTKKYMELQEAIAQVVCFGASGCN